MRVRSGLVALVAACLAGSLALPAAAADISGRRTPVPTVSASERPTQPAPAPLAEAGPEATGTLVAEPPAMAQAPAPEEDAASPAPLVEEAPAIPDFLRRSGSRAGGPANELNTGDSRAREQLPGGSVPGMLAGRDLYHGNYCGPGDRGPGVAPTDALDAVCQRHDACYAQAGHRSCGCDRALKASALEAAATPSLSRELRARAASVAEAVPLMGCVEP